MPSTISAGTTGGTAIAFAGDTSGELQLRTNGTTPAVTISTAQNATFAGSVSARNTFGFENRIINGAMTIDQRNAGASVSAIDGAFQLDRWKSTSYDGTAQTGKFTVQQDAGAVTPPAGFIDYLGVTSSATTSLGSDAEYTMGQNIEGFNIGDLGWGTANAQTVTLSFWVRSSLTGTFGGSLRNANVTRSYPFSYTISSANTWEQKSITIAGDTTGTWLTNNNIGIRLSFGLGVASAISGTAGAWVGANRPSATGATSVVGTSGATWYVTGVQLEVGSLATSFDFRSIGQELALCQRYYQRYSANASFLYITNWGSGVGATSVRTTISPKVSFRVAPTSLDYANIALDDNASAFTATSVTTYGTGSVDTVGIVITVASGLTQFRPYVGTSTTSNGFIGLSAEL
jgi:hypothetical protein